MLTIFFTNFSTTFRKQPHFTYLTFHNLNRIESYRIESPYWIESVSNRIKRLIDIEQNYACDKTSTRKDDCTTVY